MTSNSFEYIEKTLPKVVDMVFAKESMTDALIGQNALKLDFLDAKTVKVFMLASTGLTDYKRGGYGNTNKRGSAKTTTESFTLTQERYSEIPLDKLDTIDDGETVLAHQASEFIRTKVVPEFDTYRFSKIASYTNSTLGNRVVETIGANTIITKFNAGFKWMTNHKVPEGNQIIYVNAEVMEQIRNTTELYKKLSQSEYSANVSFSIEKYENRQIVVVPDDQFYTDAVTGDGVYPSASSKLINFMIVDKSCPIIVKKLDYAKVFNSTDQNATYLGFVGYLLTNLYYHDLFVPQNKRVGVYASVSSVAATSVSSALLVDAVASDTATYTHLNSFLTQPAGMLYDAVYWGVIATKPALGATLTVAMLNSASGATLAGQKVADGSEIVPNATHNFFVATLDGVVVAVSADFTSTLPVGA